MEALSRTTKRSFPARAVWAARASRTAMTVAEVTAPVTVRKWLWFVGLINPKTFTRGLAALGRARVLPRRCQA